MRKTPLGEVTNVLLRGWDEKRGTEVRLLNQRRVRKIFRRTSKRPGW